MKRPRHPLVALLAAVAIAALAGCSSAASPAAAPAASTLQPTETLAGSITVFGAASLTATFTTLAANFEAEHASVTVKTTFNGSAALVTQLQAGAPADVFASAVTANMQKLTGGGLIAGSPDSFATNVLTIAVPVGNPAKITSFADLARAGVKTVVCAPAVPCGAAAKAIEAATGVTIAPVSEENAVTGVLAKVQTGEADAGLVYVTDVKGAAGKVDGVTFAESATAVNTYPIGVLAASTNQKTAAAFVAYVLSATGQKVLRAAGFGAP